MKLTYALFLSILFFFGSLECEGRGVNGGIPCAACTVLVGLIEEIAEVHKSNISKVVEGICLYLPPDYVKICNVLIEIWGPAIIENSSNEEYTLYHQAFLKYEFGKHLREGMQYAVEKSRNMSKVIPLYSWEQTEKVPSICSLPAMRFVCSVIKKIFNLLKPAIDIDQDSYSIIGDLRGSSWRGKDCDDFNENVYPGRHSIDGDRLYDGNCNGIWGENLISGETYENELCNGTNPYGLIYIGDSIGAHCHIPPQWLTATQIDEKIFQHFAFILGNELDWPETSFSTGFRNISWPTLKGYTSSLYLKLRNHNLCNHRDFQNLAVNGADSEDLNYLTGISRNKTTDKPAIVMYAMLGNDVCESYMSSLDNLTTPEKFRKNVVKSLEFLDNTLPMKSHVVLVGLVDGKFIYPTMKDRIHPFGSLNKDITYDNLYSWFNCMKIGPCYGWLNKNESFRNATSKRAAQLSDVLKTLPHSSQYKSFQLHYIENPMKQVLKLWEVNHQLWQLLEPLDSIHPVQEVQPLMADVFWKELMKLGILGKPNPNNRRIKKLFGAQGGY